MSQSNITLNSTGVSIQAKAHEIQGGGGGVEVGRVSMGNNRLALSQTGRCYDSAGDSDWLRHLNEHQPLGIDLTWAFVQGGTLWKFVDCDWPASE